MTVNRRLDEWVKLDQLDLDSVETVVDEKVEDKVIVSSSFLTTSPLLKPCHCCYLKNFKVIFGHGLVLLEAMSYL